MSPCNENIDGHADNSVGQCDVIGNDDVEKCVSCNVMTESHSESVWVQPHNPKFNPVGKGLIQPAKAECAKLDVSVAPPEKGSQNGVLHLALGDKASPQYNIGKSVVSPNDMYRSDECAVVANESQVPVRPSTAGDATLWKAHEGITMDWDSWAKQLLAMLGKASLSNKGVDITAMPDRGIAERPVVEGALVPAKVAALQSEETVQGTGIADVLSTTPQLNNVECQSDSVTCNDLQRLTDSGAEGISVRHV